MQDPCDYSQHSTHCVLGLSFPIHKLCLLEKNFEHCVSSGGAQTLQQLISISYFIHGKPSLTHLSAAYQLTSKVQSYSRVLLEGLGFCWQLEHIVFFLPKMCAIRKRSPDTSVSCRQTWQRKVSIAYNRMFYPCCSRGSEMNYTKLLDLCWQSTSV